MSFIGSVPRPIIDQMFAIVNFADWRGAHVCCSGSFRVDQSLKARFPDLPVFSNDVSLLSCALGALATNQPIEISFKDRLAFAEEWLEGRPFVDRVATVVVAGEMAKYTGRNDWARAHFDHYRLNFGQFLDVARQKVLKLKVKTPIQGFDACDFRDHAAAGMALGHGVLAFPPTYKGGYERMYRFIDESTEWQKPTYQTWDPADLDKWVAGLIDSGAPFVVYADRRLEVPIEPSATFSHNGRRDVFTYARSEASSVRRSHLRAEPFAYEPVDPDALTLDTRVDIVPASSAHLAFLKDVYLQKGIHHVSGQMNFLVYLDGRLAGGFIYSREKFGVTDGVYLLSDFAVNRNRKLSKLIALLATCRLTVRRFEVKGMTRVTCVKTTAFTKNAVSMKYRGIFELASRKPGFLNYVSEVRDEPPTELYRTWFARWAQDQDRKTKAA